jgi:hypothetical protein
MPACWTQHLDPSEGTPFTVLSCAVCYCLQSVRCGGGRCACGQWNSSGAGGAQQMLIAMLELELGCSDSIEPAVEPTAAGA